MPRSISVFSILIWKFVFLSLTELFACENVSQSSVYYNFATEISHPSHILLLGRMVEHAA